MDDLDPRDPQDDEDNLAAAVGIIAAATIIVAVSCFVIGILLMI